MNEPKVEDNVKTSVEENDSFLRTVWLWVRDIGLCLIIAWLFITFVAQNTYVDGTSMNPTLEHGDYVIINKFIYNFTEPDYKDIIVFPYENNPANPFIKRVIGLPGDEVDIHDGAVYVNGVALVEDYITGNVEATGNVDFPVTVPEGEYFVMGDHRDVSYDSRSTKVGTIPEENIIGKAGLRIWPFKDFGFVK
ncbi:signal peptidase I [Vallitalea okinawensis]|uniref:signal peptidase I n=1 Tax=Vallitalea okinawensis TaxID=2078660 RepID=UPI001A9A6717|nr:signal peptidase I [Vallitalea okinawensis]